MSVSRCGYDLCDLVQLGRVTVDEVSTLRYWANQHQDVVPSAITDVQLALFHVACKKNLDDAKKCILAYYNVKKNGPNLFDGKDTSLPELEHQLRMLEFCIIPGRREDNSCLVLHRLYDATASNYNIEPAMRLLFMTLDACLVSASTAPSSGPPEGLVMLFDMKKVSLTHLTRVKYGAIKNFFQYLQEALSLQLREIHIFNVVWFFDKCLAIMKPFMNKDIFSKMHFHSSDLNMEEFNAKFVSKSLLPSDYGGDLPSVRELHFTTCETLSQLRDYFNAEEAQRKSMEVKQQ